MHQHIYVQCILYICTPKQPSPDLSTLKFVTEWDLGRHPPSGVRWDAPPPSLDLGLIVYTGLYSALIFTIKPYLDYKSVCRRVINIFVFCTYPFGWLGNRQSDWLLFDWFRGAWNRIRLIGPVDPDPLTKLRDHRFEISASKHLLILSP